MCYEWKDWPNLKGFRGCHWNYADSYFNGFLFLKKPSHTVNTVRKIKTEHSPKEQVKFKLFTKTIFKELYIILQVFEFFF